jgi:hypothetical protein
MENNKLIRPFHLAFPVSNIKEAELWYTNILGCSIGRKSEKWIDFNLYGHQIVAHLSNNNISINTNEVDGKNVPASHFGVILNYNQWDQLIEKLNKNKIVFLIKPQVRFKGKNGEQKTFFIKDPSGNALEFKAFKDDANIFKS